MRNIKTYIMILTAAVALASCERADYPDRFRLSSGLPTVKSIRYAEKDVHIESAYMGEIICLLGDNLTSVQQMYFNDQKASLNTSYITDHTLIVAIPGNMPDVTTNKIYLINEALDTATVDFQVLPPQPVISSMSCEWAPAGKTVTITGKYLFDDENVPLSVSFPGADAESVTVISSTEVQVVVPEGAQEGAITVTTVSGTATSTFHYKDTRNMLFDWDGKYGDARAIGHGWRDGSKVIHTPGQDSFDALDGNYIVFSGEMSGGIGGTWNEDGMSFNYWPSVGDDEYGELSAQPEFAALIEEYGVSGLSLKYERLIPSSNPWQSAALQIMFSSNAVVTYDTATNAYFSDSTFPRALRMPWANETLTYDTGGEWETDEVPLSVFKCDFEGKELSSIDESYLTGLTFFLWHGGVAGQDCNPIIAIDNIRVVPNN